MDKKEKIKEALSILEDDLAKKELTVLHHCLYLEPIIPLTQDEDSNINKDIYLCKIETKLDVLDGRGYAVKTFSNVSSRKLFEPENFYAQFISSIFGCAKITENFDPVLKFAIPTNNAGATILVPYVEAVSQDLNLNMVDLYRTRFNYEQVLYTAMAKEYTTEEPWVFGIKELSPNQMYLVFDVDSEGKVLAYMKTISLDGKDIVVPQIINAVWAPRNMSKELSKQSVKIIYPDLGLEKGKVNQFFEDSNLNRIVPQNGFGCSFGYSGCGKLYWGRVEKMFKWYHIDKTPKESGNHKES